MKSLSSGTDGQLALPLALLLGALTTAAVGLLGIQELWRARAAQQLRLDRCAANQALALRKIQNSLETQNSQILAARAAKAAALAAAQAELIPPLDQALQLLVQAQELQRVRWIQIQLQAWLQKDCTRDFIRGPAAPEPLPWVRPVPDPLGPKPLQWPQNRPRKMSVYFRKKVLHSHATVYFSGSKWIATHLLHPLQTAGSGAP